MTTLGMLLAESQAAVTPGEAFLGIPATLWQMLIAAAVTITLAYMQRQTTANVREVARKADVAAGKVELVKQDLQASNAATDGRLDGLARVAADTHTLVNSNFEVQLALNAELSRWKAAQTGLPADAEAARKAEGLLADHRRRQDAVDAVGDRGRQEGGVVGLAQPPVTPVTGEVRK